MRQVQLADFSFTRSFIFFDRIRFKSKRLRHYLKLIATQTGLRDCAPMVIRAKLELSALPPKYGTVSFLLGRTTQKPTFANGQLEEDVLAYVLLLEAGPFAALQLRHVAVADIEPLLEKLSFSSYSRVTAGLSDRANIRKITARIINPAQSGLTGRSYEGSALQSEMPQYGSGKTIPRNLKAEDGGETTSVTAGASRITTYGQATHIDTVGRWYFRMCERLAASARSQFISRFAEPVDFKVAIQNITADLIVFDSLAIRKRIEAEGMVLTKKMRKRGAKQSFVKLSDAMAEQVWAHLRQDQRIKHGSFALGFVHQRKSTLNIELASLKKFYLKGAGAATTLSAYLNSKGLFSVYFDKPEFVYLSGSLFRDNGLIAEIDGVISAMVEVKALNGADREKVDISRDSPHPSPATLTNFPHTSVFDISERYFSQATYIFCDDMGDEWADQIIIEATENKMVFVHCKHGKPSTGASSLHEVVSQALKNMGNLLCLPNSMSRKLEGFHNSTIKGTNIPRIRRSPAGRTNEEMLRHVETTLSGNDLRREAAIFCSFLPYGTTKKYLENMRQGANVKPHVRQVLWLLSYFVAACREVSVTPHIYCRS